MVGAVAGCDGEDLKVWSMRLVSYSGSWHR